MSTKITVDFYINPSSQYDADELVDMFLSTAEERVHQLAADIEHWELVDEQFQVITP